MRPFRYARPGTLDKAFTLLAEYGPAAKLLAGGTDLLVQLRRGHVRPVIVVDLKQVRALRSDITQTDSRLRLGASAVITDIIADERVQRHFPALIEAARVVGSVQIRNRATLAGNICNASPAADTAPALLVYGAMVNLVSSAGSRHVPLTEFFTGPGRTLLNDGELVESIDLPLPSEPTGAAFGRVTRRRGVDLAIINVCCLVRRSGEVRFAFGAVGPRPFMVEDISGALAGEEAADILDRLIAHATPISDVRATQDYRVGMLSVMSRRAWQAATGRLRRAQTEA